MVKKMSSSGAIEPRIKKYCRHAKMSELKSQHDIRRTVITNLYESGVPLKEIQRIAGHSSLKQTFDYIKFKNSENDAFYIENLCSKTVEQSGTDFQANFPQKKLGNADKIDIPGSQG